MVKSSRLTPLGIERSKAKGKDIWLSDDEGVRGGGRLVVRVSPSGSKLFYFRYSVEGCRKQIPMRPYASEPTDGRYTLEQARKVARSYGELHRQPASRDVAAYLEAQEQAAEAIRRAEAAAAEQARAVETATANHSLKALVERYAKHLEDKAKPSAGDVKWAARTYIYESEWGPNPAKDFTPRQAAALLRKIVEAGKGRTAGKVRSILSAAYALALKSELDASAPADLLLFGIEANPIASTAALSQFNEARERALSPSEMGEVWRRLRSIDPNEPLAAHAVRLIVRLGGQRGRQLLRVPLTGANLELAEITLHDAKGRRKTPRVHVLPLTPAAKKEVEALVKRARSMESPMLFASRGKTLTSESLSDYVHEMSESMLAAKLSSVPFQFRDLRRTAETMMASLDVTKDVRAQVQSHGLSGVQDRHYDKYHYMPQKSRALLVWQAHLESLAKKQSPADRKPRKRSPRLVSTPTVGAPVRAPA